jgi:hypothetical protein
LKDKAYDVKPNSKIPTEGSKMVLISLTGTIAAKRKLKMDKSLEEQDSFTLFSPAYNINILI